MRPFTLLSTLWGWLYQFPVIRTLLLTTKQAEEQKQHRHRRGLRLPSFIHAAAAASEQQLVQQAQTDPASFAELYQQHVKQVYRYVIARVNNVADAQDLTSQTFLTALESLANYRGQGAFGAWLLGIARHKVMDHYRQWLPHPEAALDEVNELADEQPRPDEAVNTRLQLERVTAKLAVIAPERAEAIRLRLFGHLSVAEVAQLMDKQEPAVRMLIHRGLRDLQEQLGFSLEDVA